MECCGSGGRPRARGREPGGRGPACGCVALLANLARTRRRLPVHSPRYKFWSLNIVMELQKTRLFAVIDYQSVPDQRNSGIPPEMNDLCSSSTEGSLQNQGFFIWRNQSVIQLCQQLSNSFKTFQLAVRHAYDELDDNFDALDVDKYNIVRLPRIGHGKHNVHFDAYESRYHKLLVDFIKESSLDNVLTACMRREMHLRETGMSVTRPLINGVAGEGMEWHSDGSEGECTVLLSLANIQRETGALCVVPKSHKEYVLGVGHEMIDASEMNGRQLLYHYEAGVPLIIDARTLHRVTDNFSSTWRFVIWFIFDSY